MRVTSLALLALVAALVGGCPREVSPASPKATAAKETPPAEKAPARKLPAQEARAQEARAQQPKPAPAKDADDPTDRPVLVRLENATGTAWKTAYVRAGSFRVFEATEANGRTDYQPFRSLRPTDPLVLLLVEDWRERAPPLQEAERLEPARYTWRVTLEDGRPAGELVRDGSFSPSDAEVSLASADKRLNRERAQAWLHANRERTTRCGRDGGPVHVNVSMLVAPSGRVGGVRLGDDVDKATASCVKEVIGGLRFPQYTGAMEPGRSYRVWLR